MPNLRPTPTLIIPGTNKLTSNTQIIFRQRPDGAVTNACFCIEQGPMPVLPKGGCITRNLYLSCDPYMRGRMGTGKNYTGGFALNQPIPARVVAEVIDSDSAGVQPGDYVWGFLNWEEYTAVENPQTLFPVDKSLGPLSHVISVRGMPGLTAEIGMLELGQPKNGECVFVSAASGAVGSIAGQLAKLAGARVIGSAGSDRKVAHLIEQLGFDAAFNYKNEAAATALPRLSPQGIDVYFDNVGGPTLDAALANINPFARIPVCGQISGYNVSSATSKAPGQDNSISRLAAMVSARATMTGFVIYDHMHKFESFLPRMAKRLRDGSLTYFEDMVDGIENTPQAFIGMMAGDNIGKRLVRIAS